MKWLYEIIPHINKINNSKLSISKILDELLNKDEIESSMNINNIGISDVNKSCPQNSGNDNDTSNKKGNYINNDNNKNIINNCNCKNKESNSNTYKNIETFNNECNST